MPQQVHCSMMIGADETIGALTVPSTVLLPEVQNLLLVTLSKQLERSRAAICGCLQSEILPLARAMVTPDVHSSLVAGVRAP